MKQGYNVKKKHTWLNTEHNQKEATRGDRIIGSVYTVPQKNHGKVGVIAK